MDFLFWHKRLVIRIAWVFALMLLAVSMKLSSSLVNAQETEMQEYISVRESFSIQVPADWHTEEVVVGIALVTANSEAALERYNNGNTPESGDFILNVGFLPYELLQARELVPLNIQFEATPDIFLQSFLPVFRANGDAVVGDVELVSLSDTRAVGLLTFSDEGREGTVMVFIAGEEVLAFVSTVGFPGEMSEFQEITAAIAAEVEFTAPQQTLWFALLGVS